MPAHPWAFVPPCHLDNCSCIALPSHIHVGRMAPRHTTTMDGGSAENAWSNFQPTTMDGGSAENAWSNFQPTTMDGGSADFASLHGRNLLGQRICPWMDGSRAMHMYRTYGSRVTHGAVTEEQISARTSCTFVSPPSMAL